MKEKNWGSSCETRERINSGRASNRLAMGMNESSTIENAKEKEQGIVHPLKKREEWTKADADAVGERVGPV